MYDVHRLRLLRELRLRGTLTAVGAALGYSPSSISHQLGVLEREVGVPLLEPHGRRVRLTAAGLTLVAHADAIVLELERAEAAIAAGRDDIVGTVRIATFQTAAHTLLPPALDLLESRHPGLRVAFAHVAAQAAIPALVARDFDLVLAEAYPGDSAALFPAVATEVLMRDPLRLAAPPIWQATTLAALAERPWVMEPSGAPARAWTDRICREAGFEPMVAFESADVLLHALLVERGRAAAFLPGLAGTSAMSGRHELVAGHRSVSLAWREGGNQNPAVRAVRAALHDAVDSQRPCFGGVSRREDAAAAMCLVRDR